MNKIFIWCGVAIALAFPAAAFAHATPVQYTPEASSVLGTAPASVRIQFSERIEPGVSSISVFGPDGAKVNIGNGGVNPNDARLFGAALMNGGKGTYTVSWQVISADDGHFTKGAYVFSVGAESPAAASNAEFQIVHSSSVPEAATVALELVGEALLLGALAVLAFIWRPMRKKFFAVELSGHEEAVWKRARLIAVIGLILALAGGVSYLIYKTSELATLQESSFSAVFIPFVNTVSGLFTVYRMIGAIVFLCIFLMFGKTIAAGETVGAAERTLWIILALTALARARVSHAAASTFAPAFSVLMNFIHLFFKDIWIGGIAAFVLILAPVMRKLQNLKIAAYAMSVFSKIASVSFGVAGVTGVYIVWLHLKSFQNLLTTDWGKAFIILSVFAGLLAALRVFHQLYFEPLAAGYLQKQPTPKLAKAIFWLGVSLPSEVVMGLTILCVTGLLIITTPPVDRNFSFQREAVSQGVDLRLTQHPYERGEFLVELQDEKTGGAAAVNDLAVTLTNQKQGIGPIIAPVTGRFIGGYIFPMSLLSPAGTWKIDLVAKRGGAYDAAASFTVNYPQEINDSSAHAEDRRFGLFEILNILVAAGIAAVSFRLYRVAGARNRTILAAAPAAAPLLIDFNARGTWLIPLVGVWAVLHIIGGSHAAHSGVLESAFQKQCEQQNVMNVWHESVPERAGKATSDVAVPGCTIGLGLGQYHFADPREFAYFIRPARTDARMAVNPKTLMPGMPVTLTFTLHDNIANGPIRDLTLDHDRIIHVVIISKDFSVFAHIHPEDSGPVTPDMLARSEFPVRYTFPKPGYYMISVDFMQRAQLFSDQFYVNVGNPAAMSGPTESFDTRGNFDGYDVTLAMAPKNPKPGNPMTLSYHIEKDGQPVTDLNPYLAVPMHISIVRDDLSNFRHIHGLLPLSFLNQLLGESVHQSHLFLPNAFGPDIEAGNFFFPASGNYYIFGQFSRAGKVITTKFLVNVR